MRRRLITSLVTASLLSIFCMCPARGRTLYDLSEEVIIETLKQVEENNKIYKRYSTAQLNIRKEPTVESESIGTINLGQKVKVKKHDKKWVALVEHDEIVGYLSKKYLSKKKPKNKLYWIPEYSGYKSFMDYRKITDTSSPQWKLQQTEAYTGDYGIRMVNGRYCVAIGFAFDPKIGQYFDLVLENGTVIPCIISDEKSVDDTDEDNIFTSANGCCTEFVVDEEDLQNKTSQMGDISYADEDWDSPVEKIIIYTKKNVLEE